MPAQANATVTGIGEAHSAGGSDDWDVITPAPPSGAEGPAGKWSGSVRAYYRESNDRIVADGASSVALKRELILDTADVLLMELDTDDVITFTVDGRAGTRTARASVIPTPQLAGVPRALQTARIRLEDA